MDRIAALRVIVATLAKGDTIRLAKKRPPLTPSVVATDSPYVCKGCRSVWRATTGVAGGLIGGPQQLRHKPQRGTRAVRSGGGLAIRVLDRVHAEGECAKFADGEAKVTGDLPQS